MFLCFFVFVLYKFGNVYQFEEVYIALKFLEDGKNKNFKMTPILRLPLILSGLTVNCGIGFISFSYHVTRMRLVVLFLSIFSQLSLVQTRRT